MNLIFTQEHIILYIYGELDAPTSSQLEKELLTNVALRDYYEQQVQLFKQLDACYEEPNDTSVKIIIEESLSSNLETI
jgi:hypothetical protein